MIIPMVAKNILNLNCHSSRPSHSSPPDPFNRNPSLRPISRYLVLGFIYPSKVLMKWADDHKVGLMSADMWRSSWPEEPHCDRHQ